MSSSAIIFVFCRLANVMEFITGYFFMKCIDCTMKRRKGKLLFLPGLLLYTIVSTLVVFPKRHDQYFCGSDFICPGKFYALSGKMDCKNFHDLYFSAYCSLC